MPHSGCGEPFPAAAQASRGPGEQCYPRLWAFHCLMENQVSAFDVDDTVSRQFKFQMGSIYLACKFFAIASREGTNPETSVTEITTQI